MEIQESMIFSHKEVTMLKGVGILLVLLGHMQHISWGGAPGVVLFLIVSGYGIQESFYKNGMKKYWEKRFKKVYLPYLLVAIMNVLANWPCGKRKMVITLAGLDFRMNLDETMWYISFIFFWYVVFYVFSVMLGQNRKQSTAWNVIKLLFLAAAAFGCKKLFGIAFSLSSGANRYVFFFPLGVGLSILNHTILANWLKKHKTGFWTAVLFMCAAHQLRTYGEPVWSTMFAFTMAFMVIAAGKVVAFPEKINTSLLWLGKYSYGIYLVEGLIMDSSAKWFAVFEIRYLMDLAFISSSILVGYIFWNGLYKNVAALIFERKRVLSEVEVDS